MKAKRKYTLAEELIAQGKVRLVQEQPFYASLIMRMDLRANISVPRAQTDGTSIEYNPAFIESLNVPEIGGLLAHEVMHVALLHHTRRGNRCAGRWNHACDYAINPIILKSGMRLPKGCLLDKRFIKKTAERIYDLLPDDPEGYGPTDGEVVEPPSHERIAKETTARHWVAQALLNAKMRGKMPGDLERMIDTIFQPIVDWRTALQQFVADLAKTDYTWSRPSPRFLYLGLYMPQLQNATLGEIILLVDTSYSINDKLLNQMGSEVKSIADTFAIPVAVIYIDAAVQSIERFEIGEPIELHPMGGGGTDFQPGFDYIEENGLQPRAVIYLTDGDCDSFPELPDYPVLWCQFGKCDFEPPFGEAIHITDYSIN